MNRVGRKPQGAALVEQLTGSEHAKQRLIQFLETMAGECTVVEACAKLDIHQTRFFAHRLAWLQKALELLEPRSPGRPGKPEPVVSLSEAEALRRRVQELEARAAAVEVQAELARTMPHVLQRSSRLKKTATRTGRRTRGNQRRTAK
jgi:hypothetical protein